MTYYKNFITWYKAHGKNYTDTFYKWYQNNARIYLDEYPEVEEISSSELRLKKDCFLARLIGGPYSPITPILDFIRILCSKELVPLELYQEKWRVYLDEYEVEEVDLRVCFDTSILMKKFMEKN